MNKKELEDAKWGGYTPEFTEIDPDEMSEMIGIINNIENRKADVINWDEKTRMNEATKRNGHLITSDEDGPNRPYLEEPSTNQTSESNKTKTKNRIDETKVKVTKEEKDLMETLGGIMDIWEETDGQ